MGDLATLMFALNLEYLTSSFYASARTTPLDKITEDVENKGQVAPLMALTPPLVAPFMAPLMAPENIIEVEATASVGGDDA
ncbi:hypothetical protein EAI_12435 [Harpegnathos saltator]|uniref:Uncharacterized protein n=2 Tax=Harpegnathos saltator TaxID=610380 RepID=E2BXS4_HARSA|nr:hypothetical protein EAI_12435 [Harpegnathos saltator]